ncbi:MAG: hypothetical protein AAF597_02970 [Bacteroidota bacterium]
MRTLFPSLLSLTMASTMMFGILSCGRALDKPAADEIPLNSTFSATDIPNFWRAFDLVVATQDSAEQADILEREFFAKGTPGLAGIMQARRYTKEEYRLAINKYPKFWASMRAYMLRAPELMAKIETAAEQLHAIYPSDVKADVYLTVGCFRTNGTVLDSLVLFGTELCMAGDSVDLSEWEGQMLNIKPYMESNPIDGLGFLAVHEYVHSRQPTQGGYNLLGEVVYEGVAEYIATIASGEPSSTPAIAYGAANDEAVKAAFIEDIGSSYYYDWMQNSTDNEFNTRDLGYYIGYAIVERYYEAAKDKTQTIKELIELNYQDSAIISNFVDATGYFDEPVGTYLTTYAERQPRVTGIQQFANGTTDVDPATKTITLTLSQPLDTYWKNTQFGPGGENTVPKIEGIETAEDGLSVTYTVSLEADKLYEFVLGPGYRSQDQMRLKPYLVTFQTAP